MRQGFFVPNSISSDYVKSKRTTEGGYAYDQASAEVGLGHQAALQVVNKQYGSTINNAYANFLAANRGIKGADMGQGFKEAYLKANQERLAQDIAETTRNAAGVRQEIAKGSGEQLASVQEAFQTEVANMDRVALSLNNYLGYLKNLYNEKDVNLKYLTEEQENQSIDELYDTLFDAQPQDYVDANGNLGMSFIEWVNANTKDTQADRAWSQWLFGMGGYNQFRQATKRGVNK